MESQNWSSEPNEVCGTSVGSEAGAAVGGAVSVLALAVAVADAAGHTRALNLIPAIGV
jgi:hypothetical protein